MEDLMKTICCYFKVLILASIVTAFLLSYQTSFAQTIRVGSKHFTEGYILSEILSILLEENGYNVERKYNLGGTKICFDALENNAIDVYPEYTGTISKEILNLEEPINITDLNEKLRTEFKLEISKPYGFNNTYALIVTKNSSQRLHLSKISDLVNYPNLKIALSYEFLKRKDGWENLAITYKLTNKPVGIEHGLAYKALIENIIDVTDAYSTDGEIKKNNLLLLEDNKKFFPTYFAVSFYRMGLDDKIKKILSLLANKITDNEMQAMNFQVVYDHKPVSVVANEFLKKKKLISMNVNPNIPNIYMDILQKTLQHLKITFIALFLALIVAVPLGIFLYVYSFFSKPVLYFAGLLQTIPSIALLAFMIPIFGIGVLPAIVALFLYSLLPILINTTSGLFMVDPLYKKVATGIGLTTWQKLRYIELPLAFPAILAGIKTSAVICIGTATLAAFIGAGGLGEFIIVGLSLNSTPLILEGAIPAALLAILTQLVFDLIEKIYLPKHLHLIKQN